MNFGKRKISASGLILPLAFSLLAWFVGYGAFDRLSLAGRLERIGAANYAGRLDLDPDRLGRGGPRLVVSRIRSETKKARTADVFLNGTKIGSFSFGRRLLVEARLVAPESLLRRGPNEVRLAGEGQGWAPEELFLKNYVGYSRGPIALIVVPRGSRAYEGLSWIAAVGLFAALVILRFAGRAGPRKAWAGRLTAGARVVVLSALGGAAVLPLFASYKLVFSTTSLVLFALALDLPAAFSLGKRLAGGIRTGAVRVRAFFQFSEVEAAAARRIFASVLVPVLVFLFFFAFMTAAKKQLGGNYSRFLRIEDGRLKRFEILYLNPRVTQLFENADFESGTLRNWTPEGDAFLYQPVRKESLFANGRRFFLNQQGTYWVGTYDKREGASQGDRPSGVLVSTDFVIRREKIRFLLGGGRTDRERRWRESVALAVDGTPVLEDTGHNDDWMTLREWDVRPWLGRTARIMIFDDPSPGTHFRHVNADWFHYYSESDVLKSVSAFENYDGQFNFFMAFDPLLSKYRAAPRTYLMFIDEPAYRYGRIGFPLLVKLFSGDRPVLYPKTIIWLILVSHGVGAFVLLKIVLLLKKNPLWTFLYLLVPGFYYSLDFGLPESLSTALLLAGLYAYLRGRLAGTAAAIAAALFIRETGFLMAVALMADEGLGKRRYGRALVIGSSALPYFLWRGFLTYRLFDLRGWTTLFFAPGDFTFPFFGFADLWRRIGSGEYDAAAAPTAFLYTFLLIFVFSLAIYYFLKNRDVFSLTLLLFSFLSISLNYEKIWIGMGNGIRGTAELFLFFILAFLARPARSKPLLNYALAGLGIVVLCFVFFVMYIGGRFGIAAFFW